MAGRFHALTAVGALMFQETLAQGAEAAVNRIAQEYGVEPRQVQHGIGTTEDRSQVRGRDVRGHEPGALEAPAGLAPGDSDDLLDLLLGGQRLEHARADVPGGSDHDDSHEWRLPG